jgi:outer membrane cobalamin receptor
VNPGFDPTSASLYRRGEQLVRRPATKWNAELLYAGRGPLTASARFTAVGEREDRHFGATTAPVTLTAYEKVDVTAQYALPTTSGVRSAATLRVENLTNEGYHDVFNFLAPRRTIWLGLRSTF